MTVRELRNLLDDIEDQDAEVVIFSDEEGNIIITDVECEVYESGERDEYEDDPLMMVL